MQPKAVSNTWPARLWKGLILLYSAAFTLMAFSLVWDTLQGDGTVPPCHSPEAGLLQKMLPQGLSQNTTSSRPQARSSPKSSWAALQPTTRILSTTCPHVALWLEERQTHGEILYDFTLAMDVPLYYGNTLSYQSPFTGHLLLSPEFWQATDLQKAAVLVHEYRHSRQNPGKVMFERVWQMASLQALWNPNNTRLEDEAFTYQRQFEHTLGIRNPELEGYLQKGSKTNPDKTDQDGYSGASRQPGNKPDRH